MNGETVVADVSEKALVVESDVEVVVEVSVTVLKVTEADVDVVVTVEAEHDAKSRESTWPYANIGGMILNSAESDLKRNPNWQGS